MRYDPSRTGMLRRQLIAAMRKGFMELKLELVKVIVQEDAFGLKTAPVFTVNPFVSEEQRRACYAKNDPNWDCEKWEEHTKNVFCSTGPGGGVDPTCSKGGGGRTATPEFKKWFGESKVVRNGKPAETAEAEAGGTIHEPIVVFHGTSKGAFSEFRKDKIANPNDLFFGPGFYFTEDVKAAEVFARTQHSLGSRDNPTVMKLYLKVEKPFDVDKDKVHTNELPENERKQMRASIVQRVFQEEGRSEALQAGRDFDEKGLSLDYKTLVNTHGVSKVTLNKILQAKGHDGLTVKSAETPDGIPGTNRFWIVFEPTQIKSTTATKFDPNDPNINNIFCATGIGGGIKATCKKAGAVLASAGKLGKWLKAKTVAIYKRMEARYGKKGASAIFASGQAISWGAFAVGAAAGHVIWVPSSVATIPGAAIAEVRRMAKARKRPPAVPTTNEMALSKEDIKRLGQELVDEITRLWESVNNVFCATGPGGGVDPTCGKGGTGTVNDPVRCGADLDCASTALAEGKHVRLNQPEQVSTLLNKLHRQVQKAIALGEKAPAFDLCKVSVPGTNLFCHETIGVPRAQMPQMRGLPVPGSQAATLKPNKKGKVDVGEQFIAHLEAQGIKTKEKEIRASHLRASQNEIDGARVAALVEEERAGVRDLRERPIYVTRDNYVLDGHHHWAAIVGRGYEKGKDLKIPVIKLDMDIGQGIAMANAFAKQIGIAPKSVPTANVRWKFELEGDQVRLFKEWLKKQSAANVSGKKQEELIKRFLSEAYKKGLGRAFDDTAKVAGSNREEFLRTSFGATVAPATVQLMAAQSFSDLEGVTDAMSSRMVKQLVKGFTAGESPRTIAKALAREVDIGLARAETIARTEVIRAHAQGQLNALKALGVDKIGVMVEWSTAHDGKVCPECSSMSGRVFTIQQAEGLIPAHPNCRCAFIPAGKPLLVSNVWNVFCATGPGGGVNPACKKGTPGSQLSKAQRDKARALGMVGTFPPAGVPVNAIRIHSGTAEELRFKPIMQWSQTTKSGRVSNQYRYTQDFHDRNAAEKFDRVLKVEPHLERVKAALSKRMIDTTLPMKERDGAAIASIIAETGLRPTDGEASVKHGHYGIASLRAKHVTDKGDYIRLSFIGKEGVRNKTVVRDPANVAYLRSKLDGRDTLWEAGSATAGRVLREVTVGVGGPSDVKLKDLRTVKATQVARAAVAKYRLPKLTGNVKKDAKAVTLAIKEISAKVAKVLNNTPAQAKSSYIHPAIFKAWVNREMAVRNVFCATGPGGGVDPTCKRSNASITGRAKVMHQAEFEEMKAAIKKLGLADGPRHVATLVGAPDDATVSIIPNFTDGNFLVVRSWNDKYHSERNLYVEDDKASPHYGKKVCANVSITVKEEHRGKGLGTEIFSNQVHALKEAGYGAIYTLAARGSDTNGYYTWARLGYDQKIAHFGPSSRKVIEVRWPNAKSVLDIMETKEGRQWWKEHGLPMHRAEFDLSEGSRSNKVLEKYLADRAAAKVSTDNVKFVAEPVSGGKYEDIDLDWDDIDD